MEGYDNERLGFGKMGYGRRCNIRAPCCNELYSCRHCHNEATSMLRSPFDRHEIVRQDVKQVVCSVCDTEQPVAQVCTNCGVKMGEYFCNTCKFFDADTDADACRRRNCSFIVTIVESAELVVVIIFSTAIEFGTIISYIKCLSDGSCYSLGLLDNHICVEDSMRHHCPICYEYLFDSVKDTGVVKCGHTMHCECFKEMIKREKYCCPICSKSAIDMSMIWKMIDEEIEETPMPEGYRHRKVWILCNDCNDTTEVNFHIVGQKCGHCSSYNTREIAPTVLPQ